jgi:hypothetical protein
MHDGVRSHYLEIAFDGKNKNVTIVYPCVNNFVFKE